MEDLEELKKKIKEMEGEISSLKRKNRELINKIDSKNRTINSMIDDSYNEVHFDDRGE